MILRFNLEKVVFKPTQNLTSKLQFNGFLFSGWVISSCLWWRSHHRLCLVLWNFVSFILSFIWCHLETLEIKSYSFLYWHNHLDPIAMDTIRSRGLPFHHFINSFFDFCRCYFNILRLASPLLLSESNLHFHCVLHLSPIFPTRTLQFFSLSGIIFSSY